jgi:hypothetical protein
MKALSLAAREARGRRKKNPVLFGDWWNGGGTAAIPQSLAPEPFPRGFAA